MRFLSAIALLAVLTLTSCGGDKESAARVAELQSKVDALSARVKSLEDQQLAADKRNIQHEQVIQTMNTRLRDMETYVAKLQYGQSVTSR